MIYMLTLKSSFSAGVSTTGLGECFIRAMVAKRVEDNIAKGMGGSEAITAALDFMVGRVGGDGGAVAISREGEVGVEWNSERMAWAYVREGVLHYGCNRGEDFQESM